MQELPWSASERVRLKGLHLDPLRSDRKKLLRLIEHFKAGGGVWKVSEGSASESDKVSRGLATKVRNLTRKGELDWLLPGDTQTGASSLAAKQAQPEGQRAYPTWATSEEFHEGQEFRVWLGGEEYAFVRALTVEDIPLSDGATIKFGPLEPVSETTRALADALSLGSDDLAFLAIMVIDDVQVTLEESSSVKNEDGSVSGLRRMVDSSTRRLDPQLRSARFWVYGSNHELLIRVRNITYGRSAYARIQFPGVILRTERIVTPSGAAVSAISRGWR